MGFEQMCIGCPQEVAEGFHEAVMGGITGGLIALGVAVSALVLIAVYVYFALAWRTIARKRKYKRDWLAWIPFANVSMILQMGGYHWAWIFLALVPVVGWIALWVMLIISQWRIFEKLKQPGWFSLSLIIPKAWAILYLVVIGIVAWQKKK